MKKNVWAIVAIAAIIGSGCGGAKEKSSVSSEGLLGKLPSIVDTYKKGDSTLEAEAKTSAKSMDDLVALQSKANKLKEDSKKEFTDAAAQIKLPLDIPFADSTDGKTMKIQSVQITELKWEGMKILVKAQMITPSEKIMGEIVKPTEVFAWMIDKAGAPVKAVSENWFMAMSSQNYKAGDVAELNSSIGNYVKTASLAKLVFKSKEDWNKARGF
jgi:hypothetical protein